MYAFHTHNNNASYKCTSQYFSIIVPNATTGKILERPPHLNISDSLIAQCIAVIHSTVQYIIHCIHFLISWCERGSNSQSLGQQSSVLPLSQVPSAQYTIRLDSSYTYHCSGTFDCGMLPPAGPL